MPNMTDTAEVRRGTVQEPPSMVDEQVATALDRFQVMDNPTLRWLVLNLPIIFALLLLADWLIGSSIFAGDLFRLSAVVTVVVEILLVRILFDKVPEALCTIWRRGLVGLPGDDQAAETFLDFIERFKAALNSRLAWVVGGVFAVGGIIATYPIRSWITSGGSPYTQAGQWFAFYVRMGAILEIPLAYMLGLLAWRFGVIAWFIARLGEQLDLRVQPRHPDRSGGLKPVGDLCLTNAFLLLVPAFLLSTWVVASTQPGMELYSLWSGLFKKGLVLLSVAAAFLFFRPLYHIHRQMQKRRQEIQSDLDELSGKIEGIALKLRAEADTLAPDEGARRLDELRFLEKVYQESSQSPTWPFDWNMVLKFATAEAIPILSLAGVGGPLVKVIEALIGLFPQ